MLHQVRKTRDRSWVCGEGGGAQKQGDRAHHFPEAATAWAVPASRPSCTARQSHAHLQPQNPSCLSHRETSSAVGRSEWARAHTSSLQSLLKIALLAHTLSTEHLPWERLSGRSGAESSATSSISRGHSQAARVIHTRREKQDLRPRSSVGCPLDTWKPQGKEGARQSRQSQGYPVPLTKVPRTRDLRAQETASSSIEGKTTGVLHRQAAILLSGATAGRVRCSGSSTSSRQDIKAQTPTAEASGKPPAPSLCCERCARDRVVSAPTCGAYSLFRRANSSSEGFRSGLRLGSNFFMVLGLLLRS